jgi:16S rRNA (guanine1207-N2)-methyltransferase
MATQQVSDVHVDATGAPHGTLFTRLRRWPDLEAPELFAVDAADRLLVSESREFLTGEGPIVVIGDNYGALTLGLVAAGAAAARPVRVHQDGRAGELALENNAEIVAIDRATFRHMPLDAELVAQAKLVVMRLPKALEQLDEWSALVAANAAPEVIVLAGGRDKYMTASMTDVLEKYFGQVTVGRGTQKSRVLTARIPRPDEATEALSRLPQCQHNVDFEIDICAFGGVFASSSLDIGTRALLDVLDRVPGQQNQHIIDFGCGTGVLAVQLARLRPTARIVATDQSAAAVRSANATMSANGVADRVRVVQDDGLSSHADNSADLIVFNPPFHSGAGVHADTSMRLFAEAGRVLKRGGELWVVANRHLSYRPALRRLVGSTRLISQTPKFTVTASTKDGGAADAQRRVTRARRAPRGLPNESTRNNFAN